MFHWYKQRGSGDMMMRALTGVIRHARAEIKVATPKPESWCPNSKVPFFIREHSLSVGGYCCEHCAQLTDDQLLPPPPSQEATGKPHTCFSILLHASVRGRDTCPSSSKSKSTVAQYQCTSRVHWYGSHEQQTDRSCMGTSAAPCEGENMTLVAFQTTAGHDC